MIADNVFSRAADAVRGWLSARRDFIAGPLTRLVAMCFLALSVYYLAKSISLL